MRKTPEDSNRPADLGWWARPCLTGLCHAQGRSAAGALLVALALFYVAAGESFWSPVRNPVFDSYQRLFPRPVTRFPVVIVDIDERSMAAIGRWPWPRNRLAQLIDATRQLGALAVGLDMIMPEADRLSPNDLLGDRTDLAPALRAALSELPSNDAVLASALRRVPSVVARAAVLNANDQKAAQARQTPIVVAGASPLPFIHSFQGEIANFAEIEAAASGHGYANDTRDRDGVVRAMPLVIAVGGAPAPALALEILRVATGEKHYRVRSEPSGVLGVQLGDSFVATERDGRLRLYFSPAYAARRVSAAAILRGEIKPGALANQVAIIGATAVGVADVAATPAQSRMDGVEIQAQLIENILAGSRLRRPPAARWWELLALFAVALPLIIFQPRLRLHHGTAIFLTGTVLVAIASLTLFRQSHFLFDPTFPTAGSALVFLLLLFAGFTVSERRRRELDLALEGERTERLRVAGELRAARDIQMGMLPDPRRIERLPGTLDFFALLEPAEEVGGDLYDAFMLDEHRLCFMIGDVSGKGVPASLFMALTKTLSKSLARRGEIPLERLMRLVNDEVSRENTAAMFVTTIIGMIDGRSGAVELCNAGHNAPIRLSSDRPPQQLDGAEGPPLCIDEDFPYTTQRLQLNHGDLLVLITDGVSEAEDGQHAAYGTARILECFLKTPSAAETACMQLHADVKSFTAGAPPSDDLAIVAIRFVKAVSCEK